VSGEGSELDTARRQYDTSIAYRRKTVDEKKREEYRQRGLPHVYKDGTYCQCRECREAIAMGLVHKTEKPEMLYAEPDWKNTQ